MENNFDYAQETQENKGSVITGFIGALLGAAIGAVLWTVVGMLGYVASIVGFVIAFLADKGYDLFKGRQGTIKMIVLILCVVLAVGAGTVGTAVWALHDVYTEEVNALTEIEKKLYDIMPEDEFILMGLSDSEIQGEILKDAGMGLIFGFLGSFGLIKAAKNNRKQTVEPAPQEATIEMAAVPQTTEQDEAEA